MKTELDETAKPAISGEPLLAADLRIGNWIKLESGIETIIRGGGINAIEMQQLKVYPIELNPEWLNKLGFKNEEFEFDYGLDTHFTIGVSKGVFYIYPQEGMIMLPNLIFVHQLQNLYHSLTGTELSLIGS
jgi:hypothetical protein